MEMYNTRLGRMTVDGPGRTTPLPVALRCFHIRYVGFTRTAHYVVFASNAIVAQQIVADAQGRPGQSGDFMTTIEIEQTTGATVIFDGH